MWATGPERLVLGMTPLYVLIAPPAELLSSGPGVPHLVLVDRPLLSCIIGLINYVQGVPCSVSELHQ